MTFLEIANLCDRIEKSSKRLEKILILRDFLGVNSKAPIVFDMMSSNFQREINKKSLGISIKTIFQVLNQVSFMPEREIEKEFNKVGDIGKVAVNIIKSKQIGLFSGKTLLLDDVLNAFKKITNISGKDSNTKKKEILANLFLIAKSEVEYKFLARLLIDDLRIGVFEGVLKEACVCALFPQILDIHLTCDNCSKVNLNLTKCFNCNSKLDLKSQEEIVKKSFDLVQIGTLKKEVGLDNFCPVREEEEEISFALRVKKDKYFIKTVDPRNLYNQFLSLFERKYNLENSFTRIIKELKYNLEDVLKLELQIGKPIKSMLGPRAKSIEEALKITDIPTLVDFKYDGLRVQIHNKFGVVSLFSRNLENITKQFPDVVKFIKSNFSDLEFVVDSECVGFDFKTKNFLEFQLLSKRILSKTFSDVSHIKVVVKMFDLLKFGEETIISKPYEERRKLLESILIERPIKQDLCFEEQDLLKI